MVHKRMKKVILKEGKEKDDVRINLLTNFWEY